MKRTMIFTLLFALFCPLLSVSAISPGAQRVVLGEDLSEEQIAVIYKDFGLERFSVPELRVSNTDEYALLGEHLDGSLIGTTACSCVSLRILPEGSGIRVSRNNISWCTEAMYESALRTAGISDVEVMVSAPFEVSGTAALAGIYKAYEDMTGTALAPDAKELSVEELMLTGELAQDIGSFDASMIVETLKGALAYTESLSDEALAERIDEVAREYHVRLNDTQIRQLLSLCRQLEKLDELKLQEKAEEIKEAVEQLRDMKKAAEELHEKARGWQQRWEAFSREVKTALDKASSWIETNGWKFRRLWEDVQSIFSPTEEEAV